MIVDRCSRSLHLLFRVKLPPLTLEGTRERKSDGVLRSLLSRGINQHNFSHSVHKNPSLLATEQAAGRDYCQARLFPASCQTNFISCCRRALIVRSIVQYQTIPISLRTSFPAGPSYYCLCFISTHAVNARCNPECDNTESPKTASPLRPRICATTSRQPVPICRYGFVSL